MIRITEHSRDVAVIQMDSEPLEWALSETMDMRGLNPPNRYVSAYPKVRLIRAMANNWGDIANMVILRFLDRNKSNIGKLEYEGNRLFVHFFRCAGANNLYQKLLRKCAENELPKATVKRQTALAAGLHNLFKQLYNEGNSTKELKPSEFKVYYDHCQQKCILSFGVSGMDEDDGEFDHGSTPVN